MNFDPIIRKIERALVKMAIGYKDAETVKEYIPDPDDDGKPKLVKWKVKEQYIPPNLSALTLLSDLKSGKLLAGGHTDDIREMTDGQLENEKLRLIKMISNAADTKPDDLLRDGQFGENND